MARSRYSIEQKLSALRMMEEENYTLKEVVIKDYNISVYTLRLWKAKFDTDRIDALKESKTWRYCTMKKKITGVRDYLYGLTATETLSNITLSVDLFFKDGLRSILVIAS